MRPGREIDTLIAKNLFQHDVVIKRKIPTEVTPAGERPLREYSKEMGAAHEVMKALNISLIPIEGQQWFALAGKKQGFTSPADFLRYLSEGNFQDAGAGLANTAPEAICLAALNALQSAQNAQVQTDLQ